MGIDIDLFFIFVRVNITDFSISLGSPALREEQREIDGNCCFL